MSFNLLILKLFFIFELISEYNFFEFDPILLVM